MRITQPLQVGLWLLGAVFLIACQPVAQQTATTPTLFLIGDSITADKTPEAFPETGWGQVLPEYLKGELHIQNHAKNGRSTKSFRDEGLWKVVADQLKPGDFLVIGFGHNDQKIEDPTRYAEPWSDYKRNLENYIAEAQAKGASVILTTSVYRRQFDDNGQPLASLGDYPLAARQVSAEQLLPLIDFNAYSRSLLSKYGKDGSAGLYMNLAPGEFPNYPEGKVDNTHFKPEGAKLLARYFIAQLQLQSLPVGQYFQTQNKK